MLACQSIQECFPEDSYMICRACGGRTCIACGAIWHADETCDQYAARVEEEEESQERQLEESESAKYLLKETKKCPGCGAPSQKYIGCDHITCKNKVPISSSVMH